MDPEASRSVYACLRWNTPLSEQHADQLLDVLSLQGGQTALDLGCGWGELLLRALARTRVNAGRVSGTGVDTDRAALERGRRLAEQRGLEDDVRFAQAQAAEWTETADRVLCVGSSHVFGGTVASLESLARYVAPDGALLFGDGCWEGIPTAAASQAFPEVLPLSQIVAAADKAGWQVIHLSTADQREWDEFESSYRRGGEDWLLSHDDHELRRTLHQHFDEYVDVYRGVLGFCYLVLRRAPQSR
jgi:SAM-dependent methyltransferase